MLIFLIRSSTDLYILKIVAIVTEISRTFSRLSGLKKSHIFLIRDLFNLFIFNKNWENQSNFGKFQVCWKGIDAPSRLFYLEFWVCKMLFYRLSGISDELFKALQKLSTSFLPIFA